MVDGALVDVQRGCVAHFVPLLSSLSWIIDLSHPYLVCWREHIW